MRAACPCYLYVEWWEMNESVHSVADFLLWYDSYVWALINLMFSCEVVKKCERIRHLNHILQSFPLVYIQEECDYPWYRAQNVYEIIGGDTSPSLSTKIHPHLSLSQSAQAIGACSPHLCVVNANFKKTIQRFNTHFPFFLNTMGAYFCYYFPSSSERSF